MMHAGSDPSAAPSRCSCGEATPHVIARRLTADRTRVRQIERVGHAYAELSIHDAVCEICQRRPTDPRNQDTKRCPKGLVLWLTGIGEQRAIRDKWGIPRESRSPRLWGDR